MAFHQCFPNCAFASSNVGAWPLVGAPVGFGISAVIDQNHSCSADLLAVLEDAIVLEVLESRRRTDAGGAKGEGKHSGDTQTRQTPPKNRRGVSGVPALGAVLLRWPRPD